MINYTYKLIRNEGDEEVVYEPKMIPKELPSLSYIEGPNSSGKSTLLNIIALGFKGNKRKDISKALISKMNSLMDSSYQRLSFDINIKERDINLKISKDLDEDQIIISEIINGKSKPISPELLEEKFNLIYDIPDDPINRLRQLTITISNNQRFINRRIFEFQNYIYKQLELAKDARNPQLIEKQQNEINNKKKEFNSLKEETSRKKEYLDILELYTYSKFYKEYSLNIDNIDKEINKLEKGLLNTNKKIVKTYNEERKRMSECNLNILDNYWELTPLIRQEFKDEENIQNLWDSLAKYIDDIFIDLDIPASVIKIITLIESKFIKILSNTKYKDLIAEADTWKKVINLLNTINKKDSLVPGVDKSIGEFITILEKESSKYDKFAKEQERFQEGYDMLNEIIRDVQFLKDKVFPKIKESNDASMEYSDNEALVRQKIDSKILKKEEFTSLKQFYGDYCIEKGINITNYEDLSNAIEKVGLLPDSNEIKNEVEDVLLNRINQLKNLLDQYKTRINKLNSFIEIKENELLNMKNKEPYIYQDYIPDIKRIFTSCQSLDQKFKVDFETYVTKIINEESKINLNDKLQAKYYEGIAIYLGKKIGTIKHIDNSYEISKVDLVKREIVTNNNKIIKFEDMGTGQSQSTYFLGKLNSIDNRKVIVLIDEVAMMDKGSLEPIFNKLRELYKHGQLVAGMVVQKSEKVSVKEI